MATSTFPRYLRRQQDTGALRGTPQIFYRLRDVREALIGVELPRFYSQRLYIRANALYHGDYQNTRTRTYSRRRGDPPLPILRLTVLPVIYEVSSDGNRTTTDAERQPTDPARRPGSSTPTSSREIQMWSIDEAVTTLHAERRGTPLSTYPTEHTVPRDAIQVLIPTHADDADTTPERDEDT